MYEIYLRLGDGLPVYQFKVEGNQAVATVRRQLLVAYAGNWPVVYTKHDKHGVLASTLSGEWVNVEESDIELP